MIAGPVSGPTTEAGSQATFTVVLNAQPLADVTLPLASSDTTEGTVSPGSITFTAANWNAPQTVVVTGVDDAQQDGEQEYAITFGEVQSEDAAYRTLALPSVTLRNTDDETAGLTVSAPSGSTTEAGGQASFTVVLDSQPFAAVTLAVSSTNSGEGTVAPESLTFTPENWNAPQTVLVTGVDDDAADGASTYEIQLLVSASDDEAYKALSPQTVAIHNTDDDSAGFTVIPPTASTSEAGGQASFTVVLNSEPYSEVTLTLTSSDTSEGTVGPSALTFTPANWKAPQMVTVTGVNDELADGNQPYAIAFATESDDAAYAEIRPSDVALSNVDDDSAGISVGPMSGPTTEAGGQATFTVVLNSEPYSEVTLNLFSTDTGEGTLSQTSFTFTPVNWNAPQTVTVTGVDDDLADGNQPYAIGFAASTTTDTAYAAIAPANLTLTNTDNDSAGIIVSAISGPTSEAGGQASFTVVLTSQPYADVTVNFASNDTSEGTVSGNSLSFTPVNWNAPQTVRVTGVDDDLADGNQPYAIAFSATTSNDAAYAAITPASVTLTNTDDDSAGIIVSAISGPTSEAGAQASFTVVLTSEPYADVTVNFASNDTSEATVSPGSLTFTPANWEAPQVVTATGMNDAVDDGNQPYAIVFSATTSNDAAYAAITPANVLLTNTDDDSAGFTVSAISGPTTESGGQATFSVVLTSEPTHDVTVHFASSDITEGTASPGALTFTSANWAAPQNATVVGVDDDLADGSQPYAIVFSATTSADPAYAALTPANVILTNTDDDSAGITVSAISGPTTESGGTATFTVRLNSQPFADVTLSFDSNDPGEGTVSPTALTFTPSTWASVQTVTVTGVDDLLEDGQIPYAIVFTATTSQDVAYAGLVPGNVNVTNQDDELSAFSFADTGGDDVPATAVQSFFSGLGSQVTSSHYIFFEVLGAGSPGAWCAENAKWYVDAYLANASAGGSATSGSWNKWTRPGGTGSPWYGPTVSGFANYWGSGCAGNTLDWCSEWGITANGSSSLSLAVAPARTTSESYAQGWSSGSNSVTIRIATTRLVACGF